jgi:hypothetical protein
MPVKTHAAQNNMNHTLSNGNMKSISGRSFERKNRKSGIVREMSPTFSPLIKDHLIVFGITVARSRGSRDEIRNRIGSNSEKEFNNSKFLNGSEVESKASTPLFFGKNSSRSMKAGVQFLFSFFLSPFGRHGF